MGYRRRSGRARWKKMRGEMKSLRGLITVRMYQKICGSLRTEERSSRTRVVVVLSGRRRKGRLAWIACFVLDHTARPSSPPTWSIFFSCQSVHMHGVPFISSS